MTDADAVLRALFNKGGLVLEGSLLDLLGDSWSGVSSSSAEDLLNLELGVVGQIGVLEGFEP